MTLRAGELRHQITIRRATEQKDGHGGYTTVWTTIAQPRAKIEGLDGRESVMDRVLQGISVYRITIRYRADLLPGDQITLASGVQVNIRSIADPDGRREATIILGDTASTRAQG